MFGSEILEVSIGLIFIYLMLSLLVTTLNEIISSIVNLRGYVLVLAVKRMLNAGEKNKDKHWARAFFKHPVIESLGTRWLGKEAPRKPNYIDPNTFARVVTDLLKARRPDGNGLNVEALATRDKDYLDDLVRRIRQLKDDLPPKLYETLLTLAAEAENDVERLQQALTAWFNQTMDEAHGWYGRRVKTIGFLISLLIAVTFNADTFAIASKLSTDSDSRKDVVSAAVSFAEREAERVEKLRATQVRTTSPVPADSPQVATVSAHLTAADSARLDDLDSLIRDARKLVYEDIAYARSPLGLGWEDNAYDERHIQPCTVSAQPGWCWLAWYARKALGLIITAIALSLGAPFWFELLKKLVNIQSAGKAPGTDGGKGKKRKGN